ncbi:8341_t:CDS:2, partial [Entrophospora sp. SA101]
NNKMEKRKVSKRRQTGTTAKDDIEESYRMKLVAKDAVVIVISPNDTKWNSNYVHYVSVEELKDLMKPFVRCLDKLQVDKAQLHDVIFWD